MSFWIITQKDKPQLFTFNIYKSEPKILTPFPKRCIQVAIRQHFSRTIARTSVFHLARALTEMTTDYPCHPHTNGHETTSQWDIQYTFKKHFKKRDLLMAEGWKTSTMDWHKTTPSYQRGHLRHFRFTRTQNRCAFWSAEKYSGSWWNNPRILRCILGHHQQWAHQDLQHVTKRKYLTPSLTLGIIVCVHNV